MRQINIAIWGLGRHALVRILPAIKMINNFALIGVCSRNEKLVLKVASDLDCDGWISPKIMLNNPKIDVIYISTPIGLHKSHVTQALNAGKHVWCEKPLSCSLKDSRELVKIAKKNSRMLVEAFMYQYHPQFKRVQKYLNENGKVSSLICRFGMPPLEKPGFRNNKSLGGGAFWDIGSYPVSAVVALFPKQKVKILFSEVIKRDESSVDNEGRVIMRVLNGPIIYLEWAIGLGYKNEIDIWSENGSFFTDKIFSKPKNYKTEYHVRDSKGDIFIENGLISEQFEEMFHFFNKILFSSDLIHQEYLLTLERAEMMDQIVNNSKMSD